jgi:hypothetical protein
MQNQLQTLARRIVYFRKSSVQAIRFASHVVVRTISYSNFCKIVLFFNRFQLYKPWHKHGSYNFIINNTYTVLY